LDDIRTCLFDPLYRSVYLPDDEPAVVELLNAVRGWVAGAGGVLYSEYRCKKSSSGSRCSDTSSKEVSVTSSACWYGHGGRLRSQYRCAGLNATVETLGMLLIPCFTRETASRIELSSDSLRSPLYLILEVDVKFPVIVEET